MLSLECVQVHCGDITTFNQSYEWEDIPPGQGEAPRARSREGQRKGEKGNKGNKGGPKGKWIIHQKGYRGELVTRCGRETWNISVAHIHSGVKLGKKGDELRSMYLTGLPQQVDILW